jgi:transketolase
MRYGSEAIDHRVFVICSDGDLMEGVSAEAASLAGHLGLDRLVFLYDDNRITIDGDTGVSGEDEVRATKLALGWDPDLTFHVPDPVRAHFATAGERGAAARRSWGDPPTSSSRRGRRCPTEAGLAVRARAPTCTGACASTRWAPA